MKKVYIVTAILAVLLIANAAALAAVAPAPAPSPAPEADKLIKHGARGDDVKMVQKLLADTGYYVGQIDGVFGGGTLEAVKRFQVYNGLTPDGVVGKETIAFLQRERATSEPGRYSRQLAMYATAYTAQDPGNGSYTARGHKLRKGLVAVDPRVIPLGTRLFIKGYGFAIADDIGGAIKGNKIDLAFDSRAEALQFGVQKVTVYILD
jgi:3D (Asp-Asp-Asp) domain-containing protein